MFLRASVAFQLSMCRGALSMRSSVTLKSPIMKSGHGMCARILCLSTFSQKQGWLGLLTDT